MDLHGTTAAPQDQPVFQAGQLAAQRCWETLRGMMWRTVASFTQFDLAAALAIRLCCGMVKSNDGL
eukprot:4789855-Amphidinium_carterae.1